MRKLTLLSLIAALLTLPACATLALSPDATPAAKAAALCKDAQLGVVYAETKRLEAQTVESRAFWERYIEAARLALTTYCMM
jgi:hypothetical protein